MQNYINEDIVNTIFRAQLQSPEPGKKYTAQEISAALSLDLKTVNALIEQAKNTQSHERSVS